MLVKALAVLFLAASLPATHVRVVQFPGGQAVIERRNGYEQVTIKGRHGEVRAESDCDASSGTYDEIVRFGKALKDAGRRGDRKTVASLMLFPLRVNDAPGTDRTVPSKQALLARFDRVFSPEAVRALGTLEPHDVFCRNGMAMLANGLIWAQVREGILRGAVVNRLP